ncbi:MAG: tetratricopeptide repeat protein [Candidatus Peribacteraceae bacterium]|nr:tetratricopeptide repeat protein [Candidatus Peribacteraceae bacterium]
MPGISSSRSLRITGIGILLTLAVLMAFGRSLWQGYAPIDDLWLLVQNPAIRGPTLQHLKTIFTTYDPELYIPLTYLSFQLNFLVSGPDPWSYHLVNLLLHAANAFLVLLLIRRITGRAGIAFFCSMVFAVHPLMTETVVWLLARKDLLATFFSLSAILLSTAQPQTRTRYGMSLLCFFFALLSKPSAVTLPFILLLLEMHRDRTDMRRILRRLWPFLLLSGIALIIGTGGRPPDTDIVSPWLMAILPGRSVLLALRLFFLPTHFSPFYEVSPALTPFSLSILLPFAGLLMACALLFRAFRKQSPFALGALFFLLALAPTWASVTRSQTVFFTADHYLYFPSIGLLMVCAAGIGALLGSLRIRSWTVPTIVGGVILLLLMLLSGRQARLWGSAETLFTAAVRTDPASVAARTALAQIYREAEKPKEAFAVLTEGLRYGEDARLHLAAGMVYAQTGQLADARGQFLQAQTMDPRNPEPLFALGSLEEQTGQPDSALAHFRQALAMDPSYAAARIGAGRILLARGDLHGAEEEFRSALRWNVHLADAHRGMARVLVRQGQADAAEEHRLWAEEIERYTK